MLKKIINFIKYHNAVSIGISLALVLSFTAMASEDVRNAVLGEKIVTERGIDNSQLLSADLENFDINLKINNVLEDEENYYVYYAFNTIAVRDNIWQPVSKSEKFTVNKNALGDRDLGIYLAEELSEVAMSGMTYLKEAQKNEKERGQTQIIKTMDYTGLIGLTFDLKNKILSGYEPVVKPPVAEETQDGSTQSMEPTNSDNPVDTPVCDSDNLDLCITKELCDGISLYWYDNNDDDNNNDEVCNVSQDGSTQSMEPTDPTDPTDPEDLQQCVPDWECSEWDPLNDSCGAAFTQTRTCADINNCGTDQDKPSETQEAVGTDASECGVVSCDGANLAGECDNTCGVNGCEDCVPTCVCAEGYSDKDDDLSNGCEVADEE